MTTSNIILIICIALISSPISSRDRCILKIEEAENNVLQALNDLIDVEEKGVDISNLAYELNTAIDLIYEAKLCHVNEDVDSAIARASESIVVSNDVIGKALDLSLSADRESKKASSQSYLLSRFAVLVILFVSLFMWKQFKQYHDKKILGARPEVLFF